jgi:hypothetical protein
MIITERKPLFYCAHAQPTAQYEPTFGDKIRNMSNTELAELLYKTEMEGYELRENEGKEFSKTAIRGWYEIYVKTPLSEDIP